MERFNTHPPPTGLKFNLATLVRVFVLAAFLVAAIQVSVSAANTEKLEIVNNTGKNIKSYYLVQASYKDWGPERLGSRNFDNGKTDIFYYDPQFRYFKFRIVFEDGKDAYWIDEQKIDFSGLWRIAIYSNGKYSNGRDRFTIHRN